MSAGPTMVRIKWLNWLPWNIFSKIFKRSIFGFRLGWQAGHDLAVCTRVSIVAHLTVNNNGWLEFERFLTEVCPIRISRIGNAASHCVATQEVSVFFVVVVVIVEYNKSNFNHNNYTDVMDLAWSSKDQYLATCSVDNTVIIWNALKFPGFEQILIHLSLIIK